MVGWRGQRFVGARFAPALHCHDQPQHATRTLTVGDPIKVKAGLDFSAAASSASSAISKAKGSSRPVRCLDRVVHFANPFARRHCRLQARITIASRPSQGKWRSQVPAKAGPAVVGQRPP